MRPSIALRSADKGTIQKIVERHRGRNPRIIGSVARGEDRDGSDLDILIDPEAGMTLLDIGAITDEISSILGVEVDIVTTPVSSKFDLDGIQPAP
jgi:predicted nucleotidyltransferase